jgi:TonB-linked SusC/RagA family outer membrane protein
MEKNRKFIARLGTIMKISIMHLSVVLFTAAYTYGGYRVHAQELLLKPVSVHFVDTEIKTVLTELESRGNVKFVYTSRLVPLKRKVNIDVSNKSIAETLDALFSPDKVTYKIVRNRILLSVDARPESVVLEAPAWMEMGAVAERTVKGKVTDENGDGLPGVSVVVKGTQRGTVSNVEGEYELTLPDEGGSLIFSFVGFLTQEVEAGTRTALDVILKEDEKSLEEVVVVGYGTQKRGSVTAAISSVSMKEIQDMPVSNVATAMQGKIPGVVIQQSSGAPGSTPAIKVRGFGSITAGNTPLIVVDGNIVSADVFAQINSIDIESIDVLKDASSSAIYGSRGANGVVMVTTKKGKSGQASVNLDVFAGVQHVSKKMDVLNSQQFAEFSKDASNNAYLDNVPGASISDPNSARPSNFLRYRYPRGEVFDWFDFDDATKLANMPYHDYQDLIFRAAKMNSYQLSFSGGTDKTRYSVSGSYLNQEGVLRGADLKRYTFRANIETQITSKVKVGVNVIPTFRVRNEVLADGHWASNGVINAALSAIPMAPIYAADGSTYSSQTELAPAYNFPGVTNPIANITEYQNKRKTANVLANAYAEYKILENLTYRVTGNVNFEGNRRNSYRTSRMPLNQILPPSVATGTAYSDQGLSWLFNQILDYNQTFDDKHQIGVLLGMESTRYAFERS